MEIGKPLTSILQDPAEMGMAKETQIKLGRSVLGAMVTSGPGSAFRRLSPQMWFLGRQVT